jgi:outer membrane protein assembly factor BamB
MMRGILLIPVLAAAAGPDWPQWGGPNRNFQVARAKPIAPWGESGPKALWKRDLPFGSSSVAVDGNRLYTMYRGEPDSEVVLALDANTGRTVWEHKYPAVFLKGMNMKTGSGPHATILVDGDRLFAVGVNGLLHCLDKKTGRVRWSKGLIEEMGGNVMLRGYSNSPLRYKDKLIVMLGGKGHTLAALDPATGAIRWQGGDFSNSHSSPVVVNVDGQDQIVCVVEKAIAGFDPADGSLLWSHPHENRGGDITTTPIWGPDNILFFSGAYQGGSRALRLTRQGGKTTVAELWFHRQMRVHHSDVMRVGDHVYGPSGDFSGVVYMCVDIRTGDIKWRDRALGRANTVLVGSSALLLDEDGSLQLAQLTPEGVKTLAKAKLLENIAWTPPTVAGNRIYLRDRKSILAVEVR